MRRAILSHHSGTVEAERHGQMLQCHVVYDLVIRALREGRIDVAERSESARCQSCGERDCVLLLYTHVEETRGHPFGKEVHPTAGSHCGSDTDNTAVLLCELT